LFDFVPVKKTANISTVRTTPENKAKLEQTVKALGFKGIAHFFTRSMETLLEQIAAGQKLIWPLRFEEHKKGPVTVNPERKNKKP
jgi:hypothetical protein